MCGNNMRQGKLRRAVGERPTIGESRNGEGVRQGRGRGAGLIENGGGGGGGGGGESFLWCFKKMKGCKKMKGPPLFFLENFRTSKIFATGGKFSPLANFRYYSENVFPAPVFLLHNKKQKENK